MEEHNTTVATMGGSSQVEYYLSQDRATMVGTFDSDLITHHHYYKEAQHFLKRWLLLVTVMFNLMNWYK